MARVIATAAVRLEIDKRGLAREVRDTVREALAGERGSFEVEADTSEAKRELAALTRDRRMEVKVDLDVRDLEKRLKNVGRTSSAVVGGLLSADLWRTAGRGVVSYGAAVAAVTPVVAQLGAGLLEASQAAAVLPAALAGGAAVIGTLVVGMQGFGTAVKAFGDTEKMAEALKDLSSEARATVKALDEMRPGFRELRLNTQNALFRGLDQTIGRLGRTALPVLRSGLEDIADELNDGFQEWANWAGQQGPMRDLNAILGNTGEAVRQLGPAGRDFAAALTDIVTVGAELLPGLADGAANLARHFREFIREARDSGKLEQFMRRGLESFGDLAMIIRNLGSIVATVFRGLSGETDGFLSSIRDMTDRWREFLRSAQGTEALNTVAETLDAISTVFRDVLGAVLREFGPAIRSALPAITEFARVLSQILVAAIETVAPLLRELAEWAGDNANWMAPLAAGVVALSLALRALRAPLAWLVRNLPKLGGASAAAAAGGMVAVGGAAGAAGRNLGLFGRAARGFARSGGPALLLTLGLDLIKVGANDAGESISAMDLILESAGAGASGLAAAITGNGEAMRNAERNFDAATGGMFENARKIGSMRGLLEITQEAVEDLRFDRAQEEMLNFDAVINEFGKEGLERLQFLGEDINKIGRELREAASLNEQRQAWDDYFAVISEGSRESADAFVRDFFRINTGVGSSLTAMANKSENVLSGIESNFRGLGSTARSTTQNINRDGLNAFVSIGNTARNVGKSTETIFERMQSNWYASSNGIASTARRNLPTIGSAAQQGAGVAQRAFAGAASSASTQFGRISAAARRDAAASGSAFRGVGGRIAASIGNLSSVGFNAGASVAAGLRRSLGLVDSAASGIAASIRNKLPGSPAKEGPLSGSGYPLLLGQKVSRQVADGIRGNLREVDGASAAMAQTVRDYLPSSPAKKGALKGKGYPLLAGREIVKMLAEGIRGGWADINLAMRQLSGRLSASGASRFIPRVQGQFDRIFARLNVRNVLDKKIEEARERFERLFDLRAELREGVTGRALDARDLLGLDLADDFTASDVSAGLRASLNQLLEFQADVQQLINRGFNRDLVQQIAQAGPEAGAAMADALAKATPAQLAEINKNFAAVGKTAAGFGNSIASQMFDAGVEAANGLVKGLQRQRTAIQKEMDRIGARLIASIKKALKIKSPSQEFATIGQQIMAGLLQGIEDGSAGVLAALDGVASDMLGAMTVDTPPVDLTGLGATAPVPVPAVASSFAPTYNVYAQPGMDVQQLASRVYQRGMIDYRNAASTLSVARGSVQSGVNDQLAEGVRL